MATGVVPGMGRESLRDVSGRAGVFDGRMVSPGGTGSMGPAAAHVGVVAAALAERYPVPDREPPAGGGVARTCSGLVRSVGADPEDAGYDGSTPVDHWDGRCPLCFGERTSGACLVIGEVA